ncbi:hypothetical protein, partial [Plasmodium yoelii yoelii]
IKLNSFQNIRLILWGPKIKIKTKDIHKNIRE